MSAISFEIFRKHFTALKNKNAYDTLDKFRKCHCELD